MEVENKYYQIYVNDIFDLASSIVLKCEDAAKSINQWVLTYTNASYDELDPSTWKYYLNITGQYFASDEVMSITSLDSLEEIIFSKENLEFHRATKKAYAFGTTYYKELVEKYPDQENLIRGILYPADMATAIAAYDGQILAYPASLVEDNEPSLIPALQDWINGFYRRWNNIQYQNTDNLYLTGMLAVLYASLPGAIENIRASMTFTHEVHSYHVQQYLASHSKLDKYLPYMSRSQAMFFYHNLAFIENNNGRQEIFDELLQRTFTERRLPMGHFSLLHSSELMPTESLLPLVVFEKKPLNTSANIDNKDHYSLNEVLDIEDLINPINHDYRDDEQPKIEETATYTLLPHVPTKLLQSTVVDYTDSEKYRMADIVLQHWLWLAYKGYYQAYINFTIPSTGVRLSLSPIDAFAFYAYAFMKGLGFEIDNLPTVYANRVMRIPLASLDSMRQVCQPKFVPDGWLAAARATMPPVTPMISVESFRRHCVNLFNAANEQYGLTALEEGMTARGQKEAAVARLWGDEKFTIGDHPNQNYAEWFASRNIVIKDLNNTQLLEVANIILAEATGANLNATITLKDIQRAMAGILTDLSSYSIQIGLNINTGPVLNAGFTQVRLDDLDLNTSQRIYMDTPFVEPSDISTQGFAERLLDINKFPVMYVNRRDTSRSMPVNLPNAEFGRARKDDNGNPIPFMRIGRRLEVENTYDCLVDMTGVSNPRNLTIVPGMEKFLALPLDTQLASYVDTWAVSSQ
ncbi:putative virion structural protein [Ralstonia phage RP12]|uniref:Putative virion structural protein n=1 Tax=Ralstonia phage RP12 TaxID=1923889 RepID=A0A1L7N0R5_9CAUD|nr:putative virion structural protein [Ralstonia phage RP12]BAW19062.1 putative virion structural protein [Ralstonia phage RP12]